MKKLMLVLILGLSLGFYSCGPTDGMSQMKCYENVQKVYSQAIVFPIPEKNYRFIVVNEDGSVYYVETWDYKTPKITNTIVIKRGK